MKIWAHRGASAYAPENTLPAFDLAVSMNADGVELDVHLSRDGIVVVAHDEAVDRVSDGHGLIVETDLHQLKSLDFGARFPVYRGTPIPTLAEVYQLLQATGLTVNVELKTNQFEYPGIEQKCVDLAAQYGMTGRVIYSSFNHESIRRIKRIDPSIPAGLLSVKLPTVDHIRSYAAEAVHPHFPSLYEEGAMDALRAAGIRVHPWTVDDPADMLKLRDMGVDALITNRPDLARKTCFL